MRYGEEGTSEEGRTVKMVRVVATTITELTKETVYTVEVAAVTSAGTGVYSHPQIIETPDIEPFFINVILLIIIVLYHTYRCLLQPEW